MVSINSDRGLRRCATQTIIDYEHEGVRDILNLGVRHGAVLSTKGAAMRLLRTRDCGRGLLPNYRPVLSCPGGSFEAWARGLARGLRGHVSSVQTVLRPCLASSSPEAAIGCVTTRGHDTLRDHLKIRVSRSNSTYQGISLPLSHPLPPPRRSH